MADASDAAVLSSIATSLGDLHDRVEAITSHYEGTTRDDLLGALYEAERQLRATIRSVDRAHRLLQ